MVAYQQTEGGKKIKLAKQVSQKPAWQTSEGRLREKSQSGSGRLEKLTGYQASEKERHNGNAPGELLNLDSAFGNVALGVNRQKDLTLAITQKKNQGLTTLTGDMRQLAGEKVRPLGLLQRNFFANPHDLQHSALGYKNKVQKNPQGMLNQLKNAADENMSQALQEMIPFISNKREKNTLRALMDASRCALEQATGQGQADTQALSQVQTLLSAQILSLQQTVSAKEREERGFTKKFEQTVAKARKISPKSAQKMGNWFEEVLGLSLPEDPSGVEDGSQNPDDPQAQNKEETRGEGSEQILEQAAQILKETLEDLENFPKD